MKNCPNCSLPVDICDCPSAEPQGMLDSKDFAQCELHHIIYPKSINCYVCMIELINEIKVFLEKVNNKIKDLQLPNNITEDLIEKINNLK